MVSGALLSGAVEELSEDVLLSDDVDELSEDSVELSVDVEELSDEVDELLFVDVDELSFELLSVGVEVIPLLSHAVVSITAAHTRIVNIFFFIIISFHCIFLRL